MVPLYAVRRVIDVLRLENSLPLDSPVESVADQMPC